MIVRLRTAILYPTFVWYIDPKKSKTGLYTGFYIDVTHPNRFITALVAGPGGSIFELEGYAACGMAGETRIALTRQETRPMPHGSELMFLPDRFPILFNITKDTFETVSENPFRPGERIFPVAVFNSPGYVLTGVTAYQEAPEAGFLPLFSYGAVGWHGNGFQSAALQVDRERRQDLRLMKPDDVARGVRQKQK